MNRSMIIFLLLVFSCSNRKERLCDPVDPYSFFGEDSVAFQKDFNAIATEQINHESESYQLFKVFVDTSLMYQDPFLQNYYDSLETEDYQLAINCILLFTDRTVDPFVRNRHHGAVADRMPGCFWIDALIRYEVDLEIKRTQNLRCYYGVIKKNKSSELHILFLKMLIADYEDYYGNEKYSVELRKELVEKNFFKSYNGSY